MAKKKFIPLTGLGDMSEAQREEYKINACDFFELPPELNLLEFIWMDSGDGGRSLVLYAKKGATDMLRSSRGICVDTMKEVIGDGFIMFTATGHDKAGRIDVAVGAADTKGRSGKYLTDAIMTAQTRASRRLTLQFVGGGLLDESEVNSTTSNLSQASQASQASQPLAEIAAPAQLSPNPAPGRDITIERVLSDPDKTPMEVRYTYPAPGGVASPPLDGTTVRIPIETPKKRRRRKSSEISLDPQPLKIEKSDNIPCDIQPTESQKEAASIVDKIIAKSDSAKLAYHAFGTHAAVCDFCIQDCQNCHIPIRKGAHVDVPNSLINLNENGTPHICAPLKAEVPILTLPPVLKDQPTDVQKVEFKKRLFAYTNDVLRQGKMVPCEGIGGIENKMKAFVKAMFQTQDTKNLTVNQWETFLGYLDEKLATLGGEGLVKLINEKIGAKE